MKKFSNFFKIKNNFQIFKKREFYIPAVLETTTKEFKRGDEIFSSIRIKSYSVLFSGESNVKIEEVRICYETSNIQRYSVKIEPYDAKNKIDYLWQTSRRNRKRVFFDCIDSDVFFCAKETFKVNFDYFIPCLVLRFMINQKLLNDNDIKAFLITFDKLVFRKNKEFQEPRDSRAISLASIFLQGVKTFSFANEVCGNPLKFRLFYVRNFFDGNIFQSYYHKINNNDPEMKINFMSKTFVQMYEFVTMNLKSYVLPVVLPEKVVVKPLKQIQQIHDEYDSSQDEKPGKCYLGRGLLCKIIFVKYLVIKKIKIKRKVDYFFEPATFDFLGL